MYLDYSKLRFDSDGTPETPELVLKTMSEQTIGTIPGVSNLKLTMKFAEPSEIEFDVAATVDGEPNWIYDKLTGHKIIYTEAYGIYVIMNPSTKSDGVSNVKHIEGYSIEKTLSDKKFFIEEGTFKFFNRTNAKDPDTVIGRVLEVATGWSIGTVSYNLAQRYRTFDQYDDYLLSFLYGDAKEKFRAIFVFDPYAKTISAYDADEARPTLPIYLDFDNLVTEIDVEEQSDELVTAIRPYGADELDIRDVNPIGSNWIYDISYFISEGDIPKTLADKWAAWQRSVLNSQMHYKGIVALQASATARLLAARASLADMMGEAENLKIQQSVTIQALAMETTTAGKASQQRVLDNINTKISQKNAEISSQESVVNSILNELDESNANSYPAQIKAIVDRLSIKNYFTSEEYETLSKYLIEQDITEDTFVATSVDESVSGSSYTLKNETMQMSGSSVSMVDLSGEYGKRMYILSGGTFNLSGTYTLYGDIIRGTVEVSNSGTFVMSVYAGTISTGNATAPSGMLTVSGTLSTINSDVKAVSSDGITTYEGTYVNLRTTSAALYLTANVSDYQKYSVEMELFDYAVNVLNEVATPTYEFSVNSGNFIFAQEFEPFRNSLRLGDAVYLNIGERRCITPLIIEFTLDFENRDKFSILFSNRFKRYDETNTFKELVEKSYSTSRSITTKHHVYNETASQASAVARFMKESIESAVNTIVGAKNQSVIIDGSGINISSTDSTDPYIQQFQMRLVNGMMAMTKDNWKTVDIAIGVFKTSSGYHEGVNAHVLSGEMIIGNDLIIENPTDNGVMQFKVDSSGAWLNNSTFVLQKDNGGKLLLDPRYGLLGGTGNLFSVNGTTVTPSFVGSNGEVTFDKDGMPKNTNFFIDARNGNAYFRGNGVFSGTVYATDGVFSGVVRATDFQDAHGNSLLTKNGKWKEELLDLTNISGRVETCDNVYKITIQNYTDSVNGYISQVSSFEQTVNGFQTTVANYQSDVNGYKNQVSTFNQTVNGFNTTVSNYESDVRGYKNQVSSFEQTVNGFNTTVSSYTTDVNGYKNQVSTFQQTVNGFDATVKSYQTTLNGYSNDVASYKASVDGYSSTVASYKSSVDGYSSQVSSFEQTVNGFNATVSNYTTAVNGFKSEVSQALKFDANGLLLTSTSQGATKTVHFGNGNVDVYGGYFKVLNSSGYSTYGYIGHGNGHAGRDSSGRDIVTDGVVLSYGSPTSLGTYGTSDYYVICTSRGVRMQAPNGNSIYVMNGGVYKSVNGVHSAIGAAVFM